VENLIEVDARRFKQSPPRPPAVLTVKAGDRRNAMACEWNVPLSFDPPLLGVSVGYTRATYPLMEEAQAFGVCYLPWELAWIPATVGACSMNDVGDKFERFGLRVVEDEEYGVLLLPGALTYVCTKLGAAGPALADHRLYIGQVVRAYAPSEERVLGSLYLGGGAFSPLEVNHVRAEDLRAAAGVKVPGYDYQEVKG
jgi:flavin reductase (DIM6/NTAB) family NADH-FMN oxidoreductase RutF